MNEKWFPNGEPDAGYPEQDDNWFAQQDSDQRWIDEQCGEEDQTDES